MNEQQAPAPLAQGPLLVPPLRSQSLAVRQVPDSLLSPLQAVFWKRTIWAAPRLKIEGRPKKPWACAWLAATRRPAPSASSASELDIAGCGLLVSGCGLLGSDCGLRTADSAGRCAKACCWTLDSRFACDGRWRCL